MRVPKEIKDQAVQVARNYPRLFEYLSNYWQQELRQLPDVREHTAVAQGRCSMLAEVLDLFQDAPDRQRTP